MSASNPVFNSQGYGNGYSYGNGYGYGYGISPAIINYTTRVANSPGYYPTTGVVSGRNFIQPYPAYR